MKPSQIVQQRNNEAREAELNDELDKAIALYEKNVQEPVADPFAFDRLMVIYRKQKAYKEELRVIKKGIELFAEQTRQQLKENISGKKNASQLVKLSNAFMKGAGLVDKKGNDTYLPEPVNKWTNRKSVVEKKLKAK
jgi:hypothetical protein